MKGCPKKDMRLGNFWYRVACFLYANSDSIIFIDILIHLSATYWSKGFFLPGISELLVGHQGVGLWQIWVHQKHVRWKLNPHLKTCRPFSINFTQKSCWLRKPTLLTLRTWCSASWDCRPLGSKNIRVKIYPAMSQTILSWAIHSCIPPYPIIWLISTC